MVRGDFFASDLSKNEELSLIVLLGLDAHANFEAVGVPDPITLRETTTPRFNLDALNGESVDYTNAGLLSVLIKMSIPEAECKKRKM